LSKSNPESLLSPGVLGWQHQAWIFGFQTKSRIFGARQKGRAIRGVPKSRNMPEKTADNSGTNPYLWRKQTAKSPVNFQNSLAQRGVAAQETVAKEKVAFVDVPCWAEECWHLSEPSIHRNFK